MPIISRFFGITDDEIIVEIESGKIIGVNYDFTCQRSKIPFLTPFSQTL